MRNGPFLDLIQEKVSNTAQADDLLPLLYFLISSELAFNRRNSILLPQLFVIVSVVMQMEEL